MNLYRRHRKNCPHRRKGCKYTGCNCPIWIDGDRDGRQFRVSLKLKDWQRAIRKLATLEDPDAPPTITVRQAVSAWEAQLQIEPSTMRKYRNAGRKFTAYCQQAGVEVMSELRQEHLDGYRASRKLARSTSTKELQTLRQFLAFCLERRWVAENYARRIKPPKWKPSEILPYTPQEVARIIAASDNIGHGPYERLRARAMVLLLRHTALRVSDVASLARERAKGGQIILYTRKTGGHVMLPIPKELQHALASLPVSRRRDGALRDSGYFFWNGTTSKRAAVGDAERTLAAVFRKADVPGAHAHRFRHTLATEILARGGTLTDVADVLAISEHVARKHYAKWSQARQDRITALMRAVQAGTSGVHEEKAVVLQ